MDDADWQDGAYRASQRGLDGGCVIETGTHHELMHLGCEYAAMFTLQAGGYRTEPEEAV